MSIGSKRVSMINYAIRDLVNHARRLEREGKKVIYLNIGDPALYFETPLHIREAFASAAMKGYTYYAPSEGILELREAICRKEREVNGIRDLTPDDVLVTAGVSEGIQLVLPSIADIGDEILVPDPSYPPYISYAFLNGIIVKKYRCIEDDGWIPDIDDLRKKMGEKVKAIVLINPNNPSGAVYSDKIVREVLDVAGEYEIPVISDEIYDLIVYDGGFRSTASLSSDVPVIGLNGLSKTYLITGWRLGYVYFYDPENMLDEVKEGVMKMARMRLSVNIPAQIAGVAALNGSREHIKEMVSKLKERRDYSFKRLIELPDVRCEKPKGAFYIFPKIKVDKWGGDERFVEELLRSKGVLIVHGSGFGEQGRNHVRIVFLPPIEILEEAFNKIEEFILKGS